MRQLWRGPPAPGRLRAVEEKQAHRDRLTAIDASFLHQEKQASHMHVGALITFEGPPPAPDELIEHIGSNPR